MNDCKKSKLLFDEAFFGELTGQDKTFLDRHLENCPKCRVKLDQNSSLLSAVTQKKAHEPQPGFWDNYTTNLHRRMVSEGHLTGNQLSKKQTSRRFSARFIPAWALQGAAAVIILIVGIFIGRQFFAPGAPSAPAPGPGNQNNAYLTSDLALRQKTLQRTVRFLDRSRVILLAIENFDPATQSAGTVNLPYQKEISRDLLKQAISLKQDLSSIRQRRLKELIAELEVILLQIANIDSGSEMETLQLVKGGQYIRGILFKIRINDLRRSTYKTKEKKRIGSVKSNMKKI